MTKISKLIAAAGALGMMGAAVLPVAGYAATDTGTTTVEVVIEDVCSVGQGGSEVGTGDLGTLTINLGGAYGTSGEVSSNTASSYNPIIVSCNDEGGWELTEEMDEITQNLVDKVDLTNLGVFGPWSNSGANVGTSPTTTVADFSDNTWGARYAIGVPGTGATVSLATGVNLYHAVPMTATVIASTPTTNGASAGTRIDQTFGAKTDGGLKAGTYSGDVLYTLTGRTP